MIDERKIYMTVGVPGSGKSTWASEQGLTTFSSDAIRLRDYGSLLQTKNAEVFETLYAELNLALDTSSESVIFDATNLSRKKRRNFYDQFHERGKIIAVYFPISFEQMYENNEKRPFSQRVPEFALEQKYFAQEVPRVGVDCDQIIVPIPPMTRIKIAKEYRDLSRDVVWHDSPYHLESIQDHISTAISLSREFSKNLPELEALLVPLAAWHDRGKFIARRPSQSVSAAAEYFRSVNEGRFFQYIGHENVSAMYYLSSLDSDSENWTSEEMSILELIFQHDNATTLNPKIVLKNALEPIEIAVLQIFNDIDEGAAVLDLDVYNEYMRLLKVNKK